jgi:hypothetical protein
MGVPTKTHAGVSAEAEPTAFRDAVAAMKAARMRPEMHIEPMPAPQRIAPYAFALSGDIDVDSVEVGTGRLILLHDPAGNDAWDGDFRCVAYARAEIEPDMITDPLLADVGWSWLVEALAAHAAEYHAVSGTVTRVATENYGGMQEDGGAAQVEIRASWTPLGPALTSGTLDMTPHVEAWGELLCTAAGLPPVPEGVAVISNRRNRGG